MRAVDLHVNAGELADTYKHMRVWLDHEDCVPMDFDQTGDGRGGVDIRVSFVDDELADAFEREFSATQV